MSEHTIWICCAVLKAEINELVRLGKLSGEFIFLDSILHMNPPKLESVLDKLIVGKQNDHIYLIYGDCCSGMEDFKTKYGVKRVDAINCIQLLIGKTHYRELMKNEAFILLPEWAKRWEEIFKVELGLDNVIAKELMTENRKELVYIDTGMIDIPFDTLKKCSDYLGLPLRIERIDLTGLLNNLMKCEK